MMGLAEPWPPRPFGWIGLGMALALLAASGNPVLGQDESEKKEKARLAVSGYGLLGNRQLKNVLQMLVPEEAERAYYEANFAEDAALVLLSRVRGDGYLQPKVRARMILEDGRILRAEWQDLLGEPLPRPLRIREVEFEIDKGILYYFDTVDVSGLQALSTKEARGFFMESGPLVQLKRNRPFTPQRLEQSLENLLETLRRRGLAEASGRVTEEVRNHETGAVRISIAIDEGDPHLVRTVRQETYYDQETGPSETVTTSPAEAYSAIWVQDFAQELRRIQYQRGYPDTTVEIQIEKEEKLDGVVYVDLLARIQTGIQVTTGNIRFEGLGKTRASVLARRVPLKTGERLDRALAEEGRTRLSRLGIFDSVDLQYVPESGPTRDVVYAVREGKEIDVSLLVGFGSYELLRAGVELEQNNVFGRAHHARFRAIQSVKASSADYTYTMPELLGNNYDVFIHAAGLRREEISFVREEFGGGAGTRTFLEAIASDASLRYSYEVLNAADQDPGIEEGPKQAGVSALIAELRHDQRDSPLYPRNGYQLFSIAELATQYLGGSVDYAKLELGGSYHRPLSEGRWIHLGLSHGVILTMESAREDLPFNKRFFPGGENSNRGFQQGEAAPRNRFGTLVGAEAYFTANFELEQALTTRWSLVGFVDSTSFARGIGDYPFDETLIAAGGGLRWKTLIGPIRLEYGYNLNPRPADPAGTFHLSIGFPF